MSTVLPADLMNIWMSTTANLLAEACPRLTELDAAIGDADHGVNMESGFRAIAKELAAQPGASPSQTLLTAASVLRRTTGGTSGALWAGALRRAGKTLEAAEVFDQWALLHALEQAWAAIGDLGGASEGDSTLLDAVLPATRAMRSQLEAGVSLADALREAHRVAERGAAATADRIAIRGRSSYLGERAIGTPDPGAVSAAVVLQGLLVAVTAVLR
jgi:dihydroxyacetone kinase-like protein